MQKEKPVRIPQQTRSLATKEKLVEAAKILFGEVGYYKTTANAISRKAGTSVGSFYAYFPDKEAILAELIERVFQRLHTALEHRFAQLHDSGFDPKGWIAVMTQAYTDTFVSEPTITIQAILLYYNKASRVTTLLQREQTAMQQVIRSYFALFGDQVRVRDLRKAAAVVQNILIHIPGRVLMDPNGLEKEQAATNAAELIERYLFR